MNVLSMSHRWATATIGVACALVTCVVCAAPTAEPFGKPLVHEAIVEAPVAEVWRAFTTKEGIESWMLPHAEIDLRIGGKMRTNYHADGVLGDENTIENTILSFDPLRMLSIKATKAPENFPYKKALEGMWSVLYFEPLGPSRTRVRIVGLGYGEDEASQGMRAHFDRGNRWTLQQLAAHFAKDEQAPAADRGGPTPAAEPE